LLGRTPKNKRRTKKLHALAADPSVDLWAMDEVHFQQHGSRCRMWVPPEVKDPVLLHHPTRQSVGYFGAVRLRDGKFVFSRETNRFDAQTTWSFLNLLRQRSRRAGRAVALIIDNAKYHHANLHRTWRQEQAPDFVLDYLPPYSPDLNPIERIWKLVRRLRLHDEYFPTLQAVIDAVESQFAKWGSQNETLRRLCAI
jgi:transposase